MEYIDYVESSKRGLPWAVVRGFRYLLSFVGTRTSARNRTKRKYGVALCAIFKNEGMFLREWLEYHRLVGVEHFYLYNNFSDDDYRDILAPYVREGIVTLTEWAVPYGQLAAYEDCFKRFRDETQWIGYIDLDEFVCLRRETSLGRWLASFRKYPCVHVYWKMFGTSGVLEHDPQVPVIEQYTACWPLQANVGKSFVNTDFEIVSFNCHLFYAETTLLGHKVSLLPVNEFKRFIHHWKARAPRGAKSEAQINHYYNRSYAQYLYKTLRRGDACSAGSQKGREDKERFAREENQNTARDYAIQRFLLQLKLRLNDNPAIKAGTSV